MAIITPAVIPGTHYDLLKAVRDVSAFADKLHVDVCDGAFTETPTWPYRKHDDRFDAMLKEQEGMPGWDALDFDVHMMCTEPQALIEHWLRVGASRIFVHVEASDEKGIREALAHASTFVDVGLAIKLDTPLSALEPFLNDINAVLCMSIARIGKQGENFDERAIPRIAEIKAMKPELHVAVDGGVSLDNARALADAGADELVCGSSILKELNPASEYRLLQAEVE